MKIRRGLGGKVVIVPEEVPEPTHELVKPDESKPKKKGKKKA